MLRPSPKTRLSAVQAEEKSNPVMTALAEGSARLAIELTEDPLIETWAPLAKKLLSVTEPPAIFATRRIASSGKRPRDSLRRAMRQKRGRGAHP